LKYLFLEYIFFIFRLINLELIKCVLDVVQIFQKEQSGSYLKKKNKSSLKNDGEKEEI